MQFRALLPTVTDFLATVQSSCQLCSL